MSFDVSDLPRRRPVTRHPLAIALAAAGVSITDAARLLGCTRPWLSPVLHGRAKPSPELARKMEELTAALAEESARQEGAARG